jgi:hypothetical protein
VEGGSQSVQCGEGRLGSPCGQAGERLLPLHTPISNEKLGIVRPMFGTGGLLLRGNEWPKFFKELQSASQLKGFPIVDSFCCAASDIWTATEPVVDLNETFAARQIHLAAIKLHGDPLL